MSKKVQHQGCWEKKKEILIIQRGDFAFLTKQQCTVDIYGPNVTFNATEGNCGDNILNNIMNNKCLCFYGQLYLYKDMFHAMLLPIANLIILKDWIV